MVLTFALFNRLVYVTYFPAGTGSSLPLLFFVVYPPHSPFHFDRPPVNDVKCDVSLSLLKVPASFIYQKNLQVTEDSQSALPVPEALRFMASESKVTLVGRRER